MTSGVVGTSGVIGEREFFYPQKVGGGLRLVADVHSAIQLF